MPIDLINALLVTIQIVRRFKWIFIGISYVALFAVLEYKVLFLVVPIFFLAAMLYSYDRQREVEGKDDFRGMGLFHRYGDELDHSVFSLPVKPEWSAEEAIEFARSLQADIAGRIARRLPESSVQVKDSLAISDQGTGEGKSFLRVLVRSKVGSVLTHFVHYAAFGRTITAHYFTYLRGTYTDWDVVRFVLESPFTIWFWIAPWVLNRHSIIVHLSRFRESSFEGINIDTMHTLTHRVLFEETTNVLHEAGVLTEEARQELHYHLHNRIKIGGQTVKVQSSPGARIEGISYAASALRPSA